MPILMVAVDEAHVPQAPCKEPGKKVCQSMMELLRLCREIDCGEAAGSVALDGAMSCAHIQVQYLCLQ